MLATLQMATHPHMAGGKLRAMETEVLSLEQSLKRECMAVEQLKFDKSTSPVFEPTTSVFGLRELPRCRGTVLWC